MTSAARARLKRCMDLAIAVPLLAVTVPVQILVGLAVARELGRPVFFRQQRPGLDGKPFELIKFRTMRQDAGRSYSVADDATRMTELGRFLRSTSLDELPTLWNVLRGEMSIVGPRPLLMQYLQRYTPEQARRHDVKPGMTGLAQISGRNAISWEDKFALDVTYVDSWSIRLDLRILLVSVRTVLRREGISAVGSETTAEFVPPHDVELQPA